MRERVIPGELAEGKAGRRPPHADLLRGCRGSGRRQNASRREARGSQPRTSQDIPARHQLIPILVIRRGHGHPPAPAVIWPLPIHAAIAMPLMGSFSSSSTRDGHDEPLRRARGLPFHVASCHGREHVGRAGRHEHVTRMEEARTALTMHDVSHVRGDDEQGHPRSTGARDIETGLWSRYERSARASRPYASQPSTCRTCRLLWSWCPSRCVDCVARARVRSVGCGGTHVRRAHQMTVHAHQIL